MYKRKSCFYGLADEKDTARIIFFKFPADSKDEWIKGIVQVLSESVSLPDKAHFKIRISYPLDVNNKISIEKTEYHCYKRTLMKIISPIAVNNHALRIDAFSESTRIFSWIFVQSKKNKDCR